MTRTTLHRPGFTLTEAIIAVVILGIALPPMVAAVAQAHADRADATLASHARWLASSKLEDVIADRHSSTRGYDWVLTGNYPAENPVSGAPAFARSLSVAETAADLVSAGAGYKTVTVTVSWTDGSGAARSLQLAAVVTEYDAP